MTTFDSSSLLTVLASWSRARALRSQAERAKTSTRARTWVISTIRFMWHVAGFGSLTLAGFTWNITAGLVVAGVSCLLMSWLTAARPSQPPVPPPHPGNHIDRR